MQQHVEERPRPLVVSTNGFAVASLVLGIVWAMGIGSVLALVFGYMGKNQIDQSGGAQTGRGMAIAGIVLGWIGVALLVLMIAMMWFGWMSMSSGGMNMMGGMGMMGGGHSH
jgi:hypothetical protein